MIEERFKKIRNILWWILVLNWLVAFLKIIYGYTSKTNSMLADGFHSFSDGASNIIGIIGILIAARPADENHPYGHKKYETFSSIAISMLLLLIAFNIIRSAVIRFANPVVPEVNLFSFLVMAATIAVNFFVFYYERKKSRALLSDILYADAQHTKSDIFVSLSVIFTLFAIKMGFPTLDAIVAMVISFLIAKAAIDILRASSYVLCDSVAIVSDKVRAVVMQINGVKECHQIRTRGRSDDIHLDLHVLVDASMHVDAAHSITEIIEQKLKKEIDGVTDVIVHVEPLSRIKGR